MTRADAYCRALALEHYENFSVASPFVSATHRLDLARIYAYCRTTDDFGDEAECAAARETGARIERLKRWRADVQALFDGEPSLHPVLCALRETIERCKMRPQPFLDLVDANVQDQLVSSYETWPALLAYCRWSAAPVGRMVLSVFGVEGARAAALSDDVCIGLQLANFAQDVLVDMQKGRSYLLRSDVLDRGLAGAIQAHCERARTLLASGRELETLVSGGLRRQLMLYRLGGLAIVEAIERAGYRTDRMRPRVSAAVKCELLLRALLTFPNRTRDAAGAQAL